MSWLHVLWLFLFGVIASPVSGERAELVRGLGPIHTIGSRSAIAVWSAHAFAVVAGGGDGETQSVLVGAAHFDKGRVMLFGHSFLDANAFDDAATKEFVERTLDWVAGGRAATITKRARGRSRGRPK